MSRSKHTGEHAVCCPLCITLAQKIRAPWQKDYIDVFNSGAAESIERKHRASIHRQRTVSGLSKGWEK